jgi:4-hydroxy-4-methyl-2-oxoglutarate aldolase
MAYQRAISTYRLLTETELAAWAKIPTSVASDCMNRTQAMHAEIKSITPGTTMCGQARPVTAMVGDGGIVHEALLHARRGEILVVDAGGCKDIAVWGGIGTAAAIRAGLGGLVIDGAVRDVAEMRQAGFVCFCRAIVPRGPHTEFGGIFDRAASVAGVVVQPGDIVLGDDDGVVVVPLVSADTTLAAAQAHVEKEKVWLQRIAAGETIPAIFGMPSASIVA